MIYYSYKARKEAGSLDAHKILTYAEQKNIISEMFETIDIVPESAKISLLHTLTGYVIGYEAGKVETQQSKQAS